MVISTTISDPRREVRLAQYPTPSRRRIQLGQARDYVRARMLFSSLFFLFGFLPVFLAVYLMLFLPSMRKGGDHDGWRSASHVWILSCSVFFYAWGEFELVGIMLFSTIVDYICGLGIDRAQRVGRRGRRWLLFSLFTNLGLLACFKYANFGIDNLRNLLAAVGAEGVLATDIPEIALPLGISFYTFQSMSYTIDIYRQQVKATKSLLDFACYVTMFPQLVAGPIVRYIDVAEELRNRTIGVGGFASGALRFTIGLSKKVLIANVVAVPADAIFDMPTGELTLAYAWLGALCYSLQIYFDFSGYSDMAIGLGRMLGFHYPENFAYPYIARSNQDFWRRWHISLSTWFRDYLYIPLGGNRRGPIGVYRNLTIVFVLCGLWHGASWNFVIWGAYHGLFLIFERRGLGSVLKSLPRVFQHAYALTVAIGGWILFRAETMEQAGAFYAAMIGLGGGTTSSSWMIGPDLITSGLLGVLFAMPVVPYCMQAWRRRERASTDFSGTLMRLVEAAMLPTLIYVLLTACAASLMAGTHNPFIYFRF